MLTIVRIIGRRWRFLAVLMVAGVFAAACSSNATTSATTSGSTANSSATTVMAKSGPAGTYLTDGSGKTLYLFAADTGSTSTCTGACAKFWPPLTTTGAPVAGSGVTASMLSTFKRADGTTQVDYNGHPLYYYISDTAPGDDTGQGLNLSGGLWWIVSPNGNAITTK
jgi:predicted lipoprotein with Yx(FWY)xxD motif